MYALFREYMPAGDAGTLFILIIISSLALAFCPSSAWSDPCLVVYPDVPCVYHYDAAEYYTVGPGDPLYDPAYDRGGEVLLRIDTNEIDESIYQAPDLIGFEPSIPGSEGYFFTGTDFGLIVDGFSRTPTTFVNILVVFDDFVPSSCEPEIWIGGVPFEGYVYAAGDLEVSTPTPKGYNYSDTMTLPISWRQCYGIHIWAFSDENHNGELDQASECFTAFSHDATVPVDEESWGAIKAFRK